MIATNTAMIFGMNESVISLICVAACRILMIRPVTRATSSSGAATAIAIFIASVPIIMTDSGVIARSSTVETLRQRTDQQLPAVDQHKEHDLKGQGNGGWRYHHHTERHQYAGDHQVDNQERNKDGKANLEGGFQLA